MDMVAKYNFCG